MSKLLDQHVTIYCPEYRTGYRALPCSILNTEDVRSNISPTDPGMLMSVREHQNPDNYGWKSSVSFSNKTLNLEMAKAALQSNSVTIG